MIRLLAAVAVLELALLAVEAWAVFDARERLHAAREANRPLMVPVVVAAGDRVAGSTLEPADLAVVLRPAHLVPDDSQDLVDAWVGRTLRQPVSADDILRPAMFEGGPVPERLLGARAAGLSEGPAPVDVFAIHPTHGACLLVEESATRASPEGRWSGWVRLPRGAAVQTGRARKEGWFLYAVGRGTDAAPLPADWACGAQPDWPGSTGVREP